MICAQCHQVFSKDYQVGWEGHTHTYDYKAVHGPSREVNFLPHYNSYIEFEQSARKGCHICLLFCNQIPDNDSDELRQIGLNGYISCREPSSQIDPRHLYGLVLAYKRRPAEDGTRRVTYLLDLHMLEIDVPTDESLKESAHTPSENNYNASVASWRNQGTTWIRECINHHEPCRMSRPSTCTAGRLVYIGQANDFSDMKLDIRPEDGWNNVPYVAMSHCWGYPPYMPLQLTQENFEELKTKINFHSLHITFRHAIVATRFLPPDLNVRHIWIDSLCVIQGSKEDWEIEAPKMGSIYQNAVLSLAATFGKDGKAGLFRQRDDLSLRPFIVRPDWDEKGRTFSCEDRAPEQSMLVDSVLGQRAWCFQEAILAPRIMHFSAQQLFWECSTLTANEAHPQGLPTRYPFRKSFSLDTWAKHADGPHGSPETQPYRIWDVMVSLYTQCRLTRGTDKLVAIGSLALSLQKRLEGLDTYVAGLWKSQLPHNLVWRLLVCRSGPGAHRPKDWRAPSWSWASTDGQVSLDSKIRSTSLAHAEVLDLRIRYKNDNIALGVTEAELQIRGPIALVDLKLNDSEGLTDSSKYRTFILRLKGAKFKDVIIQGKPLKNGSGPCRFDTRLGHLTTSPIYAILIFSDGTASQGVMIQRHSDRANCWERCG